MPFALALDNELSYTLNALSAKVFWCEPTLASQASLHGVFDSGITGVDSADASDVEQAQMLRRALELAPAHPSLDKLHEMLALHLMQAGLRLQSAKKPANVTAIFLDAGASVNRALEL